MTKFHFAKITTSEPKKDPELMLDISHTDPAPIWRIYVYIYIYITYTYRQCCVHLGVFFKVAKAQVFGDVPSPAFALASCKTIDRKSKSLLSLDTSPVIQGPGTATKPRLGWWSPKHPL